MLTHADIASFLASLRNRSENARFMRAVIWRAHTGRWPTWIAHAMYVTPRAVIEIAHHARGKDADRHVVITWSLHKIGMRMRPCDSLREAMLLCTDQTFRLAQPNAEPRG